LLKRCRFSLSKPFAKLFKYCLDKGSYPDTWKKANSTPIFKKDKDYEKINYRPISLLSCISKVFERLIFNALYSYCIANKLLTERNSGFKMLDSTVNQLIHIVNAIYKGLDMRSDICSVFSRYIQGI